MAVSGSDIPEGGYSLVEILTVIAISSILLSIATVHFNKYFKRYQSEAQTRVMYADLLSARANALYHRRETRVKVYPTRFEVYSSLVDRDGGAAPVLSRQLQFPIVQSKSGNNVDFKSSGLTFNERSICQEPADDTCVIDSIVISTTRISLGKRDGREECGYDSITKK
ncbi:type II secretion system protein [Geomonas sp.]|uniref:pilus assembly FimT family protein n=1 Tax=Geomonas sp. TaxID=2651584 RepID=UPI002B489DA0|nr:type II secretion system protein [Geomonas sp.]HJV36914.1 type II secretion system protein [Geomonas sp.]